MPRWSCPARIHDRVLSGGASIGGPVFPYDADSANELLKVADTALYALKARDRGGIKLFQSYMREEAQRVASQLSLARTAINEHMVQPHYQPKVDFASGKVAGFEALLRWSHPTRGLQQPSSIEEACKDYERASKGGRLMQDKVFAQIAAWRREGFDFGRISINAARPNSFATIMPNRCSSRSSATPCRPGASNWRSRNTSSWPAARATSTALSRR